MDKINRRKLIGLIANEWYGIEICKVDDIITFIENIPDDLLEQPQKLKPVPFKRTGHDFCDGVCEHSHFPCERLKIYNNEYQYTDYKCPSCNKIVSDGTPNNCCHFVKRSNYMKELGVKEAIEYLRRHFDDRFFDGMFDARSAQKKAIEALEKQIPKKPDLEGDGYDKNGNLIYDTAYCPNCRHTFEVDYDATMCCPVCGQALDWSK